MVEAELSVSSVGEGDFIPCSISGHWLKLMFVISTWNRDQRLSIVPEST